MTPRIFAVVLLLALSFVACGKPRSGADQPLRIATAASLVPAMEEIRDAYTARTKRTIVIVAGSSGQLVKQIEQGAPFDVFASADESWVDRAIEAKVAVADTKTLYAYGRVVAWSSKETVPDLMALTDPRFKKISMATPEAAPYGRAAVEALKAAGVWDQIESRVVYGSNVRQALQYAETDNADVVLTALSLVMSKDRPYYLVDDATHSPLAQVAVACTRGDQAGARDFIAFVNSPDGHAILRRYGLMQRGESVAAPAK